MYLPLDSPEFLPYKTFGQKLKLLSKKLKQKMTNI